MNNKFKSYAGIICLALILLTITAYADVKLPALVSDGMVLQRDTKLKIWGWASPGEKVSVTFNGKKGNAVTGADGKWLLTLPAMKAGGPYTMQIKGNNLIALSDILLGDVWFCSGQSNMVLRMEAVKERFPDDIAGANYPQIRNFYVKNANDVTKKHDDFEGRWIATTPKTVLDVSAASYYFARQLYNKYHVPIGLLASAVDGSPLENWVSAEGYKGFPAYEQMIKSFTDTAYINAQGRRRPGGGPGGFGNRPVAEPDKGISGPKPWYAVDYVPKKWHHFWLPGYWNDQGIKDLNGIVWFRKEIEVPASMTGVSAQLYLSRIIDADVTYINGTQVGSSGSMYNNRRYMVPAGLLKPGKNLIVIKVTNNNGKGGFVADKDYSLNANGQRIDLRGDWQYRVGQVLVRAAFPTAAARPAGTAPVAPSVLTTSTGLYNAMVNPAINYAIKGYLWYQGESNTGRAKEYEKLMPALITDWRNKWQQGDLPFIMVQLPNFQDATYSPSESGWAELRSAQLKTLSVVPNAGMAVTIEVGDWNELHPTNKKAVGERLALWAEHLAYGEKNIVYSGPLYQSSMVQGNKVIVSFTSIGSGLDVKDGGDLNYFSIAGADGKYIWAKAKIEDDKVVVWNDSVANPVSVRYAWADNPDGANLANKEGMLASPFETGK